MRNVLSVVCILVLCPVLLALVFNGFGVFGNAAVRTREAYLPQLIYRDIPGEYDKEAIKAQAVLERSSLYFYDTGTWKKLMRECRGITEKEDFKARRKEIEEAVLETEGVYLTVNGRIMPGIFHRISAGQTRDGTDTGKEAYINLQGVYCSEDTVAPGYMAVITISPQRLSAFMGRQVHSLKITKRDSAGYVTEIAVNGAILDGEIFRQMLELPSACFTIESKEEALVFTCRGQGHGYGLSQTEAQRLAGNGESYLDILENFFPKYEIIKK